MPIISPFNRHREATNHLKASSSSALDTSKSLAFRCWAACSSASEGMKRETSEADCADEEEVEEEPAAAELAFLAGDE